MFSPVELEIELFCRGIQFDRSCELGADARRIARTRAGLGSGLELVLRGPRRDHWLNVPVAEPFAAKSPFRLFKPSDGYWILDERTGEGYRAALPEEPPWYSRQTSSGVEMSRIGVLQGNYLGIYVSTACLFWASRPSRACKFCTTGKNVGAVEQARKKVEDVVEVAIAARDESGSVFTHLNTGYHYEEVDRLEAIHGLRQCEPFVRALRRNVGGFIGVQCMPVPERMFHEYDVLIEAGADHFSFCYEFEDPAVFAMICPGKAETVGQSAFIEAMEYTSDRLGRGRVSGEIIAGIEPIENTIAAIERITSVGAFPTVCVFRPTVGSDMEDWPSPKFEDMRQVLAAVYDACRRHRVPIGLAPNIEVSLVVNPDDAALLAPVTAGTLAYEGWRRALRLAARPVFNHRMRAKARRKAVVRP